MHGYRCVYDDGAFAYMQVPLGVLPNNENTTEGMVEILEQMSGYVPEVQVTQESEETVPFPLAMAGDMLTAARARTAQEVRVTSPGKRLFEAFSHSQRTGTPRQTLWRYVKLGFFACSFVYTYGPFKPYF